MVFNMFLQQIFKTMGLQLFEQEICCLIVCSGSQIQLNQSKKWDTMYAVP